MAEVETVLMQEETMLPHSYDTTSTAEWPMFVVPFEVLLEKNGFAVHEDLLAEGKLVPWKKGMPTLFVSQVHNSVPATEQHPSPVTEALHIPNVS